jgi:GT2 family glycosyltransferase
VNNNLPDLSESVIAIGDRTFLVANQHHDTEASSSGDGSENVAVELEGGTYFLLHAEPESFADASVISLADYLKSQRVPRTDQEALLVQIFGSKDGIPVVDRDPSAIGTLFEITSHWQAAAGLTVLHQIAGAETSILVHSRDLELPDASSVYVGNASSLKQVRVDQHGRLLARPHPKLRLTSFELDPAFKPDKILVLNDGQMDLLPVKSVLSASPEEAFHRYSGEAPDVLQMFYQCCRPMRAKFSQLFAGEALPTAISDPGWGFRLRIDTAFQLPNGYFLSGWYVDPEERLVELLLLDQRLGDADVTDQWQLDEEVWEQDGKRTLAKRFRAFIPGELDSQPLLVRLKANLRGGVHQMLAGPKVNYDTTRVRDTILATIEDRTFSRELFSAAYAPALGPLQSKLNARQEIRSLHAFGPKSKREVSVVIPLYAQLGFIRAQLMAFVNDPHMCDSCQIIYSLDDPRLVHEARALLEGYRTWADLDIELVVLERNGGYAMANNAAIAAAEGEHVVLLNSDVIPARSGWIEAALAEISQASPYSVIGPKLLYADESLQHAGMFFERFPHGFWQNLHYWKGYGRAYAPAAKRRNVPAVTGACMILRRADFLAVGGFTADYISGDYEDSDLCLKLRERGGQCVYIPEIELYHFERQSMPKIQDSHDRRSTIYNRALHTHRWDDVISGLMTEFS